MITLALLLAAQPAPALVAKADEASQTYISCLFAKSREAHGARVPVGEFKRALTTACTAEERAARELMTQVLSERGDANAAATARQTMSDARSSVSGTYESLQRLEPRLEKLAEICRQQPAACR